MSRDHPVLTLMGGVAIGGTLATFALWRYWKPIVKAYKHEGVGVGILGTGWGINVQVPRFREAGLRILALYSRDKERGNSMAEKAKILCAFTDVRALCQVNEVELVSVVTPPYLHFEHTLAALECGKHVVVEKPLTLTSAEAEKLLEAAAARPELLAIMDHECRFTSAFLKARDHIRKGTLGAILAVEITVIVPKGDGSKVQPFTWWDDRSKGGGAWGAMGSHMIDSLRFLLDAEVLEIAAFLRSTYATRREPDGGEKAITSDDYGSVQMKLGPRERGAKAPAFEGPQAFVNAHVTLSVLGQPKPTARIVMAGVKGGLKINFATSALIVNDSNGKVVEKVIGRGHMFRDVGTRNLGKAIQRALGPAQDRAALEPAATLEDGLATMYVLEAGWESSDKGSHWVTPRHVRKISHPAKTEDAGLPGFSSSGKSGNAAGASSASATEVPKPSPSPIGLSGSVRDPLPKSSAQAGSAQTSGKEPLPKSSAETGSAPGLGKAAPASPEVSPRQPALNPKSKPTRMS